MRTTGCHTKAICSISELLCPQKGVRGQGVEQLKRKKEDEDGRQNGSRGGTCAEMGMGGSNYVGNESGQIVLLSLVR